MALNPIPAIIFSLLWALFISMMAGTTSANTALPSCNGITDYITGCNGLFSAMLSSVVLGTVPGAPLVVNSFLGIIGLAARGTVIWSVLELVRG